MAYRPPKDAGGVRNRREPFNGLAAVFLFRHGQGGPDEDRRKARTARTLRHQASGYIPLLEARHPPALDVPKKNSFCETRPAGRALPAIRPRKVCCGRRAARPAAPERPLRAMGTLLDAAEHYLRRHKWSLAPCRGKVPAGRWKEYQTRRPTMAELRTMFKQPGLTGLGVFCGAVSGDLWTRDFDKPESFPRWAAAFPGAAKILPRALTARGCHVCGCHPGVRFADLGDGELRTDGQFVVLPPSRHETGVIYSWATGLPAEIPRLDPATVGLDRPWGSVTQSTDDAAPPDVIQSPEFRAQSAEPSGSERGHVSPDRPDTPERQGGVPLSVLLRNIPDGPHQNHDTLFHLARRIRGLEEQRGERYSMSDLQEAASAWCEANPHLRDGLSPEDYALELMAAYGAVRVPFGGEPTLDAAWKAAQTAPPIPEAARFGEALGELACWCRELQKVAGARAFYLSSKTVADRFGLPEAMSGWRRLRLLCSLGVLEQVEAGDRRRASTFRYKLPLEPPG
jgi:Bifunctional DNA primase/polymerase, N-terminal